MIPIDREEFIPSLERTREKIKFQAHIGVPAALLNS
jgi:hypothetical protein